MATRYGAQLIEWLWEKGWEIADEDETKDVENQTFGDQNVIHPDTLEVITVYQAVKIHKEKTGEYPKFLPENL